MKEKKVSQKSLADYLEVSQGYIAYCLTGKTEFSRKQLKKICDYLRININRLYDYNVTKKNIANLTGRTINFTDYDFNALYELPPSEELTLRTEYSVEVIQTVPFLITKIHHKVNLTHEEMQELKEKYPNILVSKITADALIAQGYTGNIFVTGRKVHSKEGLEGVKELVYYFGE